MAEHWEERFNMVNSYVQNRSQPSLATLYETASILDVEVYKLLCSKENIEKDNNIISNKYGDSKSTKDAREESFR